MKHPGRPAALLAILPLLLGGVLRPAPGSPAQEIGAAPQPATAARGARPKPSRRPEAERGPSSSRRADEAWFFHAPELGRNQGVRLRDGRPQPAEARQDFGGAPSYVVERVVDGDTIHVLRDGELEKLRLLSVDTEEKLYAGGAASPTKPQTVFGEETALWARELFASLAGEDGRTRVGLRFEGEREQRDVFGRLLCHVILPDGRDFNVLLVRLGKSPYFDKYGRSLVCHEEFVAAQAEARAAERGIWDPRTNEPAEPGAPAAKRPYGKLLPWWRARAEAVEDFRRRRAEEPGRVLSAEDPAALQRALEAGEEVLHFGEPFRLFDEEDGSLTVLLRSGDRRNALRVSIPAEKRPEHEPLRIPELLEEFRQNYVYVRGTLGRNARGFVVVSNAPSQWRRAGPEPALEAAETR